MKDRNLSKEINLEGKLFDQSTTSNMYFIKDGVLKLNFFRFIKVGLTKLCFIEVRFKKFHIKFRKEKTLFIKKPFGLGNAIR